ncbi:cyclic nucleotide-binding domain protein (macronuclear) [Tetrahymena thermophila SB210]|uniref:Cyclic nucleotide-binding domain protein n=1 Tax=Tetrahymena thermophila (strain SB210) TaxID=312017 RepID=I7MKG2_TETTS|nr:cyclic nucleotide-binding domain protein [Tetrahymena thermophila SB210]EAR98370.2 cyclic nucleotide-binding domain protein [Tetrahymena thermophila SB210]|eukprot:XP_001018615.2 cyclic nucleotide-binding domain protein [Tetrahymena thermophila SB210]
MEKQSASRTQDELQFLSDQLGDLQFFQEYVQDDMVDLLKRCVRYVKYKFCKKGEVIFHIDSEADKFYIIISGLVGVFTRPSDGNQNRKRKKKHFEHIIKRKKDSLNTDLNINQSMASSINRMSQIELQNISAEKIDDSRLRLSIASLCEDNIDDKRASMKCISQYSSMKSIKNLQQLKRSVSPTYKKNNEKFIRIQDKSSQKSIASQIVKQNKSNAQNVAAKAQRSLTIDAQEKKQRSMNIQQQEQGFFLTQDQDQKNIIQNISQQELQTKNEAIQMNKNVKNNLGLGKEQDITDKKHIYYFGEQLTKAKNMESGTAFGELALVYNKERAATIICLQDTHLAYIEKEHFIQIFSQKEERRIQQQAEYIGKLPLFSNFSFQFLRDLYYNTISYKCKKGETIFQEGSSPDNVYIVKKGEFGIFKQFQVLNQAPDSIQIGKNEQLEVKSVNPLFHKKMLKKKQIKIMSLGEYEVIGDSDLVQSRNREYSLKCTSLEGELLVIKREYFEDKIFKYQDTFNEILKRCNNQNILLSQRIENIQNQIDLFSNQNTNKTFDKKERSFTNLITDKQGIDRKLPDSPTQEKKRQFEYHKKILIHSNIQNCTDDIILPKIHKNISPHPQENSQIYPKSTANKSCCYSSDQKYFLQSSARSHYENTLISEFDNQYNQDTKNVLGNSSLNKDYTYRVQKKQIIKDGINRQEIINQQGNDRSIKSTNKKENQVQEINKYYEPLEYQFMNQQKSRDIRLIKNKRSLQLSLEQEQHNLTTDIQRMSFTPNSTKTLDNSIGNYLREKQNLSQFENQLNQSIFIDGQNQSDQRKLFDRENTKSVQGKQVAPHFRSISQQDVSTQQYETYDMNSQNFYYNKNKQVTKVQNISKKTIQETIQEGAEKNQQKQGQVPPLNLQEQSNRLKRFSPNLKNSKNLKIGNHTERISSKKEEQEKVFMDSTYGYFLKKEQAAQEVFTERYNQKPVLIEIKQTEYNKIEQNKKKIEKYHQQPISQQEKILQTLIFSNKKIKKHLFSKILGDEYMTIQNNLQSQQSDQTKRNNQNRQDKQTQSQATKYIGSESASQNGILTSDFGTRRSQETVQCNYYNLNNGFDQFQKEQLLTNNNCKNENNPSQSDIKPVKITSAQAIQLNNQQVYQQASLNIKDLNQQQQLNQQISDDQINKLNQNRLLEDISSGDQICKQNQKIKDLPINNNTSINESRECVPTKIKKLGEVEKNASHNQQSVLKNNINIFPEILNFNLESESKFIFEQYQFLDSIRDSQKYKIGSASVQNRFFKKTKKKMQETRQKINQLNQQDIH